MNQKTGSIVMWYSMPNLVDNMEATMNLGREAAEYISGTFIKVRLYNYFTRSCSFILHLYMPYFTFSFMPDKIFLIYGLK